MKIKYLKSGKYAFHPVNGPVHVCLEGHNDEMPQVFAEKLIADGWAQPFVDMIPPWQDTEWSPEDETAKEKLENYVKRKFDMPLDKRRSVANLVRFIKKLEKKL